MPDMQTALQNALKDRPLLLKSKMQRIWEWVSEHPDRTGKDIAVELKMKDCSSMLAQMQRRKMLVSHPEPVHKSGARQILRWRVNPGLHGVYELLPVCLPSKKSAAARGLTVGVDLPTPMPATLPATLSQPRDLASLIHTMSISEAYDLWKQLNRYFAP